MPIRPEHCSYTRSTGRSPRAMCASCGQQAPASIAGALIDRKYSISGTGDGGIVAGAAGVTAKADACEGRQTTSYCKVPGLRWCWPVPTSTMTLATVRSTSWLWCASGGT